MDTIAEAAIDQAMWPDIEPAMRLRAKRRDDMVSIDSPHISSVLMLHSVVQRRNYLRGN